MNADCHDLRPLIGSYVLGGLEPEETEALREHLATCPGCGAEHARLAPLPGLLSMATGAEAVAAEPPPAALEERLLDAVAREAPMQPRRRWRPRLPHRPRSRWLVIGFTTTVAAAAVAGFMVSRSEDAAGYGVRLQASAAAPRATAWAKLNQVQGGTAMHLWVKGLPRDAGAVYEVRCDAPGWSASAGTFRVGPDGTAYVELTTAARRGQYDAIRIVRRGDRKLVFSASLT